MYLLSAGTGFDIKLYNISLLLILIDPSLLREYDTEHSVAHWLIY